MKQNMPPEQMNELLRNRSVICLEGMFFIIHQKDYFFLLLFKPNGIRLSVLFLMRLILSL